MKKKKVYFNLIFIEDVEEKWTFAFHVSTLIEVSTYAQWCRFPQGVPLVRYHGTFKDLNMNWIWAGNDPTLGVDSIGTIPSALATYAAVLALQPYLIINAGTAGGFKVATILSQAIVLELLVF
ncbi:hypothetical protein GLYMA_04G006001v4 [Glycine max]|nr:hypothetical protein GYH30_008525 [Glycine max]KRH60733.2 hypothetical protein GLYMA_04G006001v4 [Glycine max]